LEQIYRYFANNPVEVVGAVLTLWSVFLNIRQNSWGWLVGIVSVLCYVYVFFKAMLLGDFLLNIYYFLVSIYGFYKWRVGSENKTALEISSLSFSNFLKISVLGVFLSIALGKLFSTYPQASLPYWDATTTAYSVLAQVLLARKKLENWLFWIFINVLCVGIYFYKELYASSILYFFLLLMALQGYQSWRKELLSTNLFWNKNPI